MPRRTRPSRTPSCGATTILRAWDADGERTLQSSRVQEGVAAFPAGGVPFPLRLRPLREALLARVQPESVKLIHGKFNEMT